MCKINSMCIGCVKCDTCPVDIAVPQMMESYNQFILADGDIDAVKNCLKIQWNISGVMANRCVACGKCEQICPQNIPIIERLKKIARMY